MKKTLKRTLSLLTAAAMVSAGAVMPASAAETTVLGTTIERNFFTFVNNETIGKVFYVSYQDSNPENVSPMGSASLAHEGADKEGQKLFWIFHPMPMIWNLWNR